ncbi:Integrator complex subunit 3 [Heterocephalus glaber]|uniref:Integrator complex subunit 3 n=1 Tax=Heterocephalus glaber TaxID=10181 RepID=G5BNY4_HETGA|nr:Integrator complex subunit 3 [Heterocephalus glaber]
MVQPHLGSIVQSWLLYVKEASSGYEVSMVRQSLRSSSNRLAQLTLEQILEHLDNLQLNLANTKQNFVSEN